MVQIQRQLLMRQPDDTFLDEKGGPWATYTCDRGVPEDPIECPCGRKVWSGYRSEHNSERCNECVEIVEPHEVEDLVYSVFAAVAAWDTSEAMKQGAELLRRLPKGTAAVAPWAPFKAAGIDLADFVDCLKHWAAIADAQ